MAATAVVPTPLLTRVHEYPPAERVAIVERAFDFAAEKRVGQSRNFGEPYIIHLLDAALTVASLRLDVGRVTVESPLRVRPACRVDRGRGERVLAARPSLIPDRL